MKRHLNITVRGRVQGVFFRASTQQKALELGVRGWVCNRDDGTVYIEAEGSETQLNALVAWCEKGPSHARVDQVSHTTGDLQNFENFEIVR